MRFAGEIWRRGWDSNPLPLFNTRNLLILRHAQNAKTAQDAIRRYTAGTRGNAPRRPRRWFGQATVRFAGVRHPHTR
jgi:hypothetical protein